MHERKLADSMAEPETELSSWQWRRRRTRDANPVADDFADLMATPAPVVEKDEDNFGGRAKKKRNDKKRKKQASPSNLRCKYQYYRPTTHDFP